MVFFSPRFAVLACLCAALPLAFPPPVEAAHLYDSHMMGKHASTSRSHQRSPSASPTHSYDGEHNGQHKAPHRRAPELPPLLRRHRDGIHGQTHAQGRQGHGPRDYAHPSKGPRSAFARSRYRREFGAYDRRSSVYVPGDHGDRYLVTRTPPNNWQIGKGRKPSRAYNRRQLDESDPILGRVDIMASSSCHSIVSFFANHSTQGAAQLTNTTQRLASLAVESTPIDWTSGQSTAKAFPLNASTTNQTQFVMMPMDESANSGGNFMKYVSLATEVFDASSAEMVMYCATYDQDPGSTSALLMTPCTGEIQSAAPANDAADPCSDDAADASSSSVHQSQMFLYDPSTGKIEPISAASTSSAVDDSSDDPTGCAGARVRRDTSGSTTGDSTTPSSTSTSTAPIASGTQQARNVTLVYVPGALEVPASSPAGSALNPTSASTGQAPVFTTTITTTVMATVTDSDTASRTVTPAQADVSAPGSSMPSLSTVMTTPSASPPKSVSSSLPSTTTSKTQGSTNASLQVEVVGIASAASTTSSSSFTYSTTLTTTTPFYSSVTSVPNAKAVAWSVANQMAQRRAFVTAAGKVNPP